MSGACRGCARNIDKWVSLVYFPLPHPPVRPRSVPLHRRGFSRGNLRARRSIACLATPTIVIVLLDSIDVSTQTSLFMFGTDTFCYLTRRKNLRNYERQESMISKLLEDNSYEY